MKSFGIFIFWRTSRKNRIEFCGYYINKLQINDEKLIANTSREFLLKRGAKCDYVNVKKVLTRSLKNGLILLLVSFALDNNWPIFYQTLSPLCGFS